MLARSTRSGIPIWRQGNLHPRPGMYLMRSGRSSPEPRLLVNEKTGYGTSTMALNGPSRLQGNLHGRFRGGLGLVTVPAHPTIKFSRCPISTAWVYPCSHDLNFSNRPVRTRMPGGVAGEGHPPYADRLFCWILSMRII